ncbi:hypothetical protein B0O80DRAFT_465471, partial [Mortierella sp. GBAus27b]
MDFLRTKIGWCFFTWISFENWSRHYSKTGASKSTKQLGSRCHPGSSLHWHQVHP